VVLLLAQLGRTKPASSGLQGAKFCGVASRKTEPAGLCFLLPVEQQELRVLELVSLEFQGEGSRLFSRGECGALSSYVCWEVGLFTKGMPSDGAWSRVVTSGAGDWEY
jgi:hypothetical protein